MKLIPFSRFVVQDKSMLPNFRPEDHVLTLNWFKPKVGDVVVFKLNGEFFLKRVKKILGNQIYVSGDNRRLSSKIAPITWSHIVGKPILKYQSGPT